MRRKRLVRLLRKLRAMRKSLPKRDQLLLRIGAAKKEAGRAFGFVKIQMPAAGLAVTRETFSFQVEKDKLKSHRTARWPLSAAQQPHRRRSGGVVETLRATNSDRECVPLVEKRTEHPAHRSSTGTSGRCTRTDCVSGLQSASHFEEPPDDARAGIDAGGGVRKAGDDPDGGGLDSHGGWPLAGDAAAHTAGARRAGTTEPDSDHAPVSTTAADQGLSDRVKIGRRFPSLW